MLHLPPASQQQKECQQHVIPAVKHCECQISRLPARNTITQPGSATTGHPTGLQRHGTQLVTYPVLPQATVNSPARFAGLIGLYREATRTTTRRSSTGATVWLLLQRRGLQYVPHSGAPAARVMLSFMMLPPMSLQPAASSCAACCGPIFTLSAGGSRQRGAGQADRRHDPLLICTNTLHGWGALRKPHYGDQERVHQDRKTCIWALMGGLAAPCLLTPTYRGDSICPVLLTSWPVCW